MRLLWLAVVLASVCLIAPVSAETIRLGAILPLTGPVASIGGQQLRGIHFAIDRVNAEGGVRGNPIELVVEDNQARPDLSIASFNKLAGSRHLPVIFTGWSGPTLAMAPLATRRKVVMINAGAQADKLTTASLYLFNTLPTIAVEISALSRYLVAAGKKRAVILFENSAGGIAGRDDYLDAFPKAGGTIAAQELTLFGQTDFRPALRKLGDAKPDVILVSVTAELPRMARQFRELGLHAVFAGTTFFQDPDMIRDLAAEGFVHTQLRIDAQAELAAAFAEKYGVEMTFAARQYYHATQIVLTTLDNVLAARKQVTGEVMRDTLLKIRKFQGLIRTEFTTNTATVPFDIKIVRGGKDVTVGD